MEALKFGFEYVFHPEIYARHTPTAEELDYIRNHPAVKGPPKDVSKYGGGELFTE